MQDENRARMPCFSKRGGEVGAFSPQPRISHRSPQCNFLSSFFGECILQAAIDFAALRNAARYSAWQALH